MLRRATMRVLASSPAMSTALSQPASTSRHGHAARQAVRGSFAGISSISNPQPRQTAAFAGPRGDRALTSAAYQLEEVDWDKSSLNTVTLTGRVGKPPQQKNVAGKVLATLSINVRSGSKDKPRDNWVDLDMWDEVAQAAIAQVGQGQTVIAKGRLAVDEWQEKDTGKTRYKTKVVVNELKLVKSSFSTAPDKSSYFPTGSSFQRSNAASSSSSFAQGAYNAPSTFDSGASTSGAYVDASNQARTSKASLWEQLRKDPNTFWDNRTTKKGKQPDFKSKIGGEGLWVDSRDTPVWVGGFLSELDAKNGPTAEWGHISQPPQGYESHEENPF
eukprot:jgi/Chlat1/7428/Chrsp6S07441